MELIIDIPDNVYEFVKNTGKFGIYRFDTAKAIKNGTPLDDVKEPKNGERFSCPNCGLKPIGLSPQRKITQRRTNESNN